MTFVGVAAHDTENAMLAFIGATDVDGFPNINDADRSVWASYGIGYQPSFVFIDDSGEMTTFGSLSESAIQDRIDELL